MNNRTYRKKPMAYTSLLIPEADKRSWTEAARDLGISQSQFLREALREKVSRTFRARRQKQNAALNANQITATA
jgi:hypothetical protein